ncbi:hypothetical protein FDECE_18641, partial [Fusarium decemcellulare]
MSEKEDKIRILWLQKNNTVSDQVFESYAIYPKKYMGSQDLFTTSRREYKNGGGNVKTSGQPASEGQAKEEEQTEPQEQVRAEGQPKPNTQLDWFALTLADPNNERWIEPEDKRFQSAGQDENEAKTHSAAWSIVTGGKQDYVALGDGLGDKEQGTAQQTMRFRKDLDRLANWQGPAQAEAIQLSLAIEAVIDALLPRTGESDSRPKRYFWTLPVQKCRSFHQRASRQEIRKETSSEEKLSIKLEFKAGRWSVDAREIDAVLSLWMYCIRSQQQRKGSDKERIETTDANFRAKGELETGLRLL